MNLASCVPSAVVALGLSTLLTDGLDRPSTASPDQPLATQAASSRHVGCAPTRAASIAIPFERVDLGPAATRAAGDGVLLGPRMFAVVTDSTQWPAMWRAAAAPSFAPPGRMGDTIPVPAVPFNGGAIVLVATRTHGAGTERLRVTSIRQCRHTGIIVVSTLQTSPGIVATSMLSRGFDVVRVRGHALAMNSVSFEDRIQFAPR